MIDPYKPDVHKNHEVIPYLYPLDLRDNTIIISALFCQSLAGIHLPGTTGIVPPPTVTAPQNCTQGRG